LRRSLPSIVNAMSGSYPATVFLGFASDPKTCATTIARRFSGQRSGGARSTVELSEVDRNMVGSGEL
jgi:hypothetical protein